MTQRAFHIVLKPGQGGNYEELHSPVPAEITAQMEAAGIYDFSIFLDGDDVFGVLRYDNEDLVRQYLAEDVSPTWTKAVIDASLVRIVDPDLPFLQGLKQVFRFEGTK